MAGRGPLGVVGAGAMGAGIAQLGSQAGLETLLYDPHADVDSAIARIVERWERKGRSFTPPHRVEDLGDLAGCETIVEAVPERLELKRELFAAIGEANPHAVLCSNTSSIPITAIAGAAPDPSKVVGLHFFNPPPAMRLVEVISAAQSSAQAVEHAVDLGVAMGKQVIRAADVTGFVVNRTNRPFSIEPLRCLQEAVANVETIDEIFRVGGRFPMGPFEFQDLVGIDVSSSVGLSFHEASFGEPRWRPSPLPSRLISAGWLGRKTGRGWYPYEGGTPEGAEESGAATATGSLVVEGDGPVAQALRALSKGVGGPTVHVDGLGGSIEGEPFYAIVPLNLVEVTGEMGEHAFAAIGLRTARVDPSPGGVLPRTICQLVNEAHFTLGEKVAEAQDIDDGMVLGLKHPRGPLAWGALLELPNVLATLAQLREAHGDAYRAAPRLRAAG